MNSKNENIESELILDGYSELGEIEGCWRINGRDIENKLISIKDRGKFCGKIILILKAYELKTILNHPVEIRIKN